MGKENRLIIIFKLFQVTLKLPIGYRILLSPPFPFAGLAIVIDIPKVFVTLVAQVYRLL